MKAGVLSMLVMLFVTYGTDCYAANREQMASNYQQQMYSDSENSERSSSGENYRKHKRFANTNDSNTKVLTSKFRRRKRRRKIGLSQGTEHPVVQTEISENAEPTNAECEICKAHSTMNNGSEPMMREEDRNSFENTLVNEPTDNATECETCKSQRLTADNLEGLKNLGENEFEDKASQAKR